MKPDQPTWSDKNLNGRQGQIKNLNIYEEIFKLTSLINAQVLDREKNLNISKFFSKLTTQIRICLVKFCKSNDFDNKRRKK